MILLIKASDLTKNTPLGGNIDVDRYTPCLWDAQLLKLEPILGEDLYNKICTDFSTNALTGDYLTLYTNYIKPFLIHATAENYLLIGAYQIANGGIFKHTAENAESVSKSEVDYLVVNQRSKAEAYAMRMEKWLCKNNLVEYKKCENNTYNVGSFWLGKNQ
jgi:hypothetical protein